MTKKKEIIKQDDSLLELSKHFGAKIPPSSDEAERAVIGAMMLDQAAIASSIELLTYESFFNLRHQLIFETISNMFERRLPVDMLTLHDELEKTGQLNDIGGLDYLADINKRSFATANIEHHARIVQEKYLKRSLIKTAGGIISDCYDETSDVFEDIDKAESEIFDIAEKRMSKNYTILGKIAKDVFQDLDNLRNHGKAGITGVPTGFYSLDKMTSGFQSSDLIIIAARPSMGKTALALSIASKMAIEYDRPIAFFSLEMASKQIAQRLLSAQSNVDLSKIRSGMINNDDNQKLVLSMNRLSHAKFYIDDSAMITVLEMRAKCRRLKAEHNIQAVFVDYIALITPPKAENRQREIALISQQLKQLAKELDIPVICLAQLNRNVEERSNKNKRPMLSDLRESGSIEQDADVVIFVHRQEYYNKNHDGENITENEGKAELIISKQRNGPTGIIEVAFIKNYAKFENIELSEMPPEASLLKNNDDFDRQYQYKSKPIIEENNFSSPYSDEDIPPF